MKLSDKLRVSENVVSREVGGEFVLLDLESGDYFGLDPVGSRIWQLIEQGECTLAQVCDRMVSEFEVSHDEVASDVLALAKDMVDRNILIQGSTTPS